MLTSSKCERVTKGRSSVANFTLIKSGVRPSVDLFFSVQYGARFGGVLLRTGLGSPHRHGLVSRPRRRGLDGGCRPVPGRAFPFRGPRYPRQWFARSRGQRDSVPCRAEPLSSSARRASASPLRVLGSDGPLVGAWGHWLGGGNEGLEAEMLSCPVPPDGESDRVVVPLSNGGM